MLIANCVWTRLLLTPLICVQLVERPPGLHVPEPGNDETEKTLIERIKSIKQEK